jgi:hypothetical protein
MARTVISGDLDLGTVEFDELSGTSAVSVTDIKDEDAMTSNDASALATQQSIKAYVDSQGASATIQACKAFLTSTNVNSATTFTQRNIFPVTASLNLNQGSFTSTTAGIAVPAAGIYLCSFNIQLNSSAARATPEIRFSIDGTGQNESSLCTYIRNSAGHNDSSAHLVTLYNLSAGDVIGLQSRSTSSTGTVTSQTTSNVSIYRVS